MEENSSCIYECNYLDIFSYESSQELTHKVFIVFLLTICICGWIGNMLICYVIGCHTHMRTASNYYLFSLAVSDSFNLVSVISLPLLKEIQSYYEMEFVTTSQLYRHPSFCLLFGTWYISTSILVSLALTVERYIAICHPFLSRTLFSGSRTIKVIIIIWTVAFIYNIGMCLCVSEFGNPCGAIRVLYYFEVYSTLFLLLPIFCNFVFYFLIGINIFHSTRRLKSFDNPRTPRRTSTIRSLKMSVAVLAECCICMCPISVITFLHKYYKPFRSHEGKYAIYKLAYGLFLLSNVINPVIYFVMSNEFRKSFKDVLYPSRKSLKTKSDNASQLPSTL